MKHAKIVAFLEAPSHVLDRKHWEKYRDDQVLHQLLLQRSMSGGRLKQVFGPDMFKRIWWDNVAPMGEVDATHIERVISTQKPDVVLCFGNVAIEAINKSLFRDKLSVLICHHPNARGKTMQDLADFAIQVCEWEDLWRRSDPPKLDEEAESDE